MLSCRCIRSVSKLLACSRSPRQRGPRRMAAVDVLRGYTIALGDTPSGLASKLSLHDIGAIVKSNTLQRLGRSRDGQMVYEEHKKHVSAVWRSIDDFILHKIFELPYTFDHVIERRVVDAATLPDLVVFTLNDFPYDRQPDIEQHVIWSTRQLTQERITRCLDENRPSNVWDYVWFENPPMLKSVKSIHHAHVFSKKKIVS